MHFVYETWEERQYRLRAWFAYRYLYRCPYVLCSNEKYRTFFQILDRFFLKRYKLSTEEATRVGIEQLFSYESEQNIIIDDNEIVKLIEEYDINNKLLTIQ